LKQRVIILGAGIAGLSASYYLKKNGIESMIIEKNPFWGGLCSSFQVDGFTFDTFAHISFDNDPETFSLLEGNTDSFVHKPDALNYSRGYWVRNPVQNNLSGLPVEERIEIIQGFVNRKRSSDIEIKSYADWLQANYGAYFSENYPYRYTRKYWTVEPEQLESKWINGRMTTPDLREILRGSMGEDTRNLHYAKEARYPKRGGFQEFLTTLAKNANILYNACIEWIDYRNRWLILADGRKLSYDAIISTIPLPELITYLHEMPHEVKNAAENLDHTSGAMISLGLRRPKTSPSLWFYIYDEDILPARVYAPDWKSPNNVPEGCSALQAEVYCSKYRPLNLDLEDLKEIVVSQMLKLGLFERSDILFSDIRYREYANVMFTPQIYEARDRIHGYLDELGILYAGRWGEWDYLWVGQSLRSGKRAAENVYCKKSRKGMIKTAEKV